MGGFGLNLKLFLYLQNECFPKMDFLNPPLLQAPKRLRPTQEKKLKNENKL